MSALRLLYLALLSPRLALFQVESTFRFSYLFIALFGFVVTRACIQISAHIFEKTNLQVLPFLLDLIGTVISSFALYFFIGLVIHMVLSKQVDGHAFPRMLTSLFLVQMPFAFLPALSIISKSIDTYAGNPALGMTFFLVWSAFIFFFVIHSISKGIQLLYRTDSASHAFSVLATSVFTAIFIQILGSSGFILQMIASIFVI